MPAEMKEAIAQAAMLLLTEKHVKKLTVKDIVDQCHITRQAFYYHFENIPALFCWMMEKNTERTLQNVLAKGSGEEGLRYFFVMAINALPYVKRGMDSNYREELEQLFREYIHRFFTIVAETKNFYANCTRAESKIILRYHSQAILGLLQEWTEEDTEQLDQIVHTVFLLITTGIPPKIRS